MQKYSDVSINRNEKGHITKTSPRMQKYSDVSTNGNQYDK
jgi:hypothetical protein